MKIVYTSENSLLVNNVKNLLEQENIDVELKNEFVRGALGEVGTQQTWMELWVLNDKDYERAAQIVKDISKQSDKAEWVCDNCGEHNDASFELCWQCQHEAGL